MICEEPEREREKESVHLSVSINAYEAYLSNSTHS